MNGLRNRMLTLLAAALIASLALAGCRPTENTVEIGSNDQTSDTHKTDDTENVMDNTDAELPYPIEYGSILADYESLVQFRLSPDFQELYNNGEMIDLSPELDASLNRDGSDLKYRWDAMVVEMITGPEIQNIQSFGYVLKDINGDSVPELFWVTMDGTILAIFTICEDAPALVDTYWSRYSVAVAEDGKLFTRGSSGADRTDFEYKQLDAGSCELSVVGGFGTEGSSLVNDAYEINYYEWVNGVKSPINRERFDALLSAAPSFDSGSFGETEIITLEEADAI